jgi:AraC-like DNA-binding protein
MHINGVIRFSPHELEAINNAIEYINQNFYKAITADELATDFKINIKKLQNGFIRKTGFTVHCYILNVRLTQAKALLSDLDEPIKTIHAKIGFRSQSHFGQFFKKYVSSTPYQYRIQSLS